MNIRGHVSLKMTIVWGIAGIGFSKIAPYIDKLLKKTEKKIVLKGFLMKIIMTALW